MSVADLMTHQPACCSKSTPLEDVAHMMVECDCGMIPIVEQDGRNQIIGTVTDRDITIRTIGEGKNPLEMTAEDVWTDQPVCIDQNADDEEAGELMSQHQVRRLIVVDDANQIVGILAQADLARSQSQSKAGEVIQNVSRSADQPRQRR